MSTERLSFGFNSLIPETYKNKAEAFARCLQHKLLSLGGIDSSSETCSGESRRLDNENQQENQLYFGGNSKPVQGIGAKSANEGCGSVETNHKFDKTDSDEEFCSHSESENDWTDRREVGRTKQKLTSMSSEDSTMDSWSSCQENLTDVERLWDSENEEAGSLAAQVRGSPKLRNFNIRTKRKELREKTWKRNSGKNHSSSTESIDSEGIKQTQNRQTENYDPEFGSDYILLDGLEPEDDEVPHRILRESSSTSNLERHFSGREERTSEIHKNSYKVERKVSEEPSAGVDTQLLTPPPSPDVEKEMEEMEKIRKGEDVSNRLQFAEIETDPEEVDFVEVECMKDLNTDGLSRSVRKINGVVVELPSDSPETDFPEIPFDSPESFVITCAEVLENTPKISESKEDENEEREEKQTSNDADIEAEEDVDILKMRRCSSLKTWKTPPGTPGGKKIVRFADALGLDLADVRTFLDEIPKIPSSAYEDLHFDLAKPEQAPPPPPPPPPRLAFVPMLRRFEGKFDFYETLQRQKIILDAALLSHEGCPTITGIVRILNVSFHKSVHVRYTLNGWQTFSDLQATHMCTYDIFERFTFVIYGHTLKIGESLEFALRMESNGVQYWDNNGGFNYVLNCIPDGSKQSYYSTSYNNEGDISFDFY